MELENILSQDNERKSINLWVFGQEKEENLLEYQVTEKDVLQLMVCRSGILSYTLETII